MHRKGDVLHGYVPKPRGVASPPQHWYYPRPKRGVLWGKGIRRVPPNGKSGDGEIAR